MDTKLYRQRVNGGGGSMNILIMKKGEYSAPALGYCAGMYQPLGSMPKRSNSLRQAVLTHELKGSSPITELICSSNHRQTVLFALCY
ncbi:hypothetical protein [Budvicia aquatica]|uniref:Uncharacterized protein n=1 Tax=Budvicia aquatica TaxID=82979 RepID=A0A484ZJ94_9GAMM|nr:Uncharacterised protein [Budvicia aquatica]